MSVNSMQLLPIAYPARASIRGVQFAMLDLGMLVHILVTHAALDRIEKATEGDDGYMARFAKHGIGAPGHDVISARSKPLRPVQGTQRRCGGCNRGLSESDSSTRPGSTSYRFG